jgi:xylulokinase
MWIRDSKPEIYEKTYRMLHAKEYIIHRLTGEFATDNSDASGTNALDLNTMKWSDEIVRAAGVEKSMFPDIKPSTSLMGVISKKTGEACGLAEGTKVILGGGDGSCASVGAGSIKEGVTYNCLGSSSWISTVSKTPYLDPSMRTVTWAHVIPGLLIPSGTMQTAGAAFSWTKERLYGEEDDEKIFRQIESQLAETDIGANALLFLPYLLGERCPRWNSDARGSFVGLKMEHTRGDMMRSVLEGIAMNLDIILGILKKAVDIKEMLVVGGMAQSAVFQRILADVFGMDIVRLEYLEEATSIGAAVIAGVGAGELDGFESAELFNRRRETVSPIAGNVDVFNEWKKMFEMAYEGQLRIYEKLAAWG